MMNVSNAEQVLESLYSMKPVRIGLDGSILDNEITSAPTNVEDATTISGLSSINLVNFVNGLIMKVDGIADPETHYVSVMLVGTTVSAHVSKYV